MKPWQKAFFQIQIIVNAIYSSIIVYVGLIYFIHISPASSPGQTQQIMFFVLLVMALATFPIAIVVGGRRMSSEKLTSAFRAEADPARGLTAAINHVRTGAIIMAALGEVSAIYGLIFYFLSGDSIRPWVFIALSVVHYALTMMKLRGAREDIDRLSQGS
jgi:hypothetical protein